MSVANGHSSDPRPPLAAALWTRLAAIPGSAAVVVASIYAFGAVEAVSQLRGEGLDPLASLPLIPLSHILANGLAFFLGAVPFLFFLGLPTVAFLALLERYGPDMSSSASARKTRAPLIGLGLLPVSILVLVTLIGPFVLVAKTLIAAAIGGALLHPMKREARRQLDVVSIAAMLGVAILAFSLAGAVLTPDPLPPTTLALKDGTRVQGTLVSFDGSSWCLGRKRRLIVINADRVRVAHVNRTPRVHYRRLREILF